MLQKKKNDTNYRYEIFYAYAVIVTLQSAKTTLLALFLAGGDRARYFLDKPRECVQTVRAQLANRCCLTVT